MDTPADTHSKLMESGYVSIILMQRNWKIHNLAGVSVEKHDLHPELHQSITKKHSQVSKFIPYQYAPGVYTLSPLASNCCIDPNKALHNTDLHTWAHTHTHTHLAPRLFI